MLSHKASLAKLKKIKILSSIFSDTTLWDQKSTTRKKKNINTNTGGKTAGYQATNGPLKKAKRKWEKKERERQIKQRHNDSKRMGCS